MQLVSRFFFTTCLVAILWATTASASFAQLSLTLTPASPTVGQNSALSFTAFLTNTNAVGGETIDLFGSSGNLTGPGNTGLTIDDSAFLAGLPLALAPTEQYSASISVIVGAASPGLYTFSYTVDGQANPSENEVSAPASTTFTVVNNTVAAPEPSALGLLAGVGLVGCAACMRRR